MFQVIWGIGNKYIKSEKLQQYVTNAQIKLVEHMNKRDALHNKIASVNDKLKKARAIVK